MNAIPGTPVYAGKAQTSDRASRYRSKFGLNPVFAPERRLQAGAPIAPPRFLPVGDGGISVEFGTEIDPALNEAVASLDEAIAASEIPGVLETVPSFRSLLVIFEPASIDGGVLVTHLRKLCTRIERPRRHPGRRWSLPIVYDP